MTPTTLEPVRLPGSRLLAVLAAAVVAAVASGVGLARALALVAPAWVETPQQLAAVIVGVVYLSIAGVLLAGFGRHTGQRRSWLALTRPARVSLAAGGTVWLGGYLVSLAVYAAASPLGLTPADALEVLWAVGADNGRLHGASPGLTAVILVRICVLAPVAEELLFRGALFTWLRQRLPASWTIAVTAAGFALVHQAPAMLPLAAVIGVAAGIIREHTGSATVPIVVHAAQNVVIVALSFAMTGWQASLF